MLIKVKENMNASSHEFGQRDLLEANERVRKCEPANRALEKLE
jgi:hypothetical protein